MRRPLLLAILLLGCTSAASAGQIYKWVDAQGITHFGARPPQGVDASAIAPARQPPAPAPAPAATGRPSEAPDPAQKEIDERVRREVADQEKKRHEYCTQLRTNLAQLRNNPRVRMEVNGEMHRVSEEQRQSRIAETEKAIGEHCQ